MCKSEFKLTCCPSQSALPSPPCFRDAPSFTDLYPCTPAPLQFAQINFAVWTKTFCNWDKYVLQFGRMQFEIWRNAFCDLNKYYLPHTFAPLTGAGVTRLAPRSSCTNLFTSTPTRGSRRVQTPVKCKPAMSHIFKDISIGNKTS